MAEGKGFEPLIRFRRIHAFQACLFNHSSISPNNFILQISVSDESFTWTNVSVHKSILFD